MFHYLPSNRTAGYSGYVLYSADADCVSFAEAGTSVWMVPGTWEDDWDNR